MKKNKNAFTLDELNKEIKNRHSAKVYEMLEADVLGGLNNDEIREVFRALMGLRNLDIMNLLAKK